jgi:hypothetical protein
MHQRDGSVDVTVDCPKNLIIATDCLLKQIMLNLGRNSTKFVHSVSFGSEQLLLTVLWKCTWRTQVPEFPLKEARSSV